MTKQHARMLAEQDGHGARSVEVCKQHTKDQRREGMAGKQCTHNTRRQSDGPVQLARRGGSKVIQLLDAPGTAQRRTSECTECSNEKKAWREAQPLPRGMRRPSRAVPLTQARPTYQEKPPEAPHLGYQSHPRRRAEGMYDPGTKDVPGLQDGAAEGAQGGSMMGRVACQASGAV